MQLALEHDCASLCAPSGFHNIPHGTALASRPAFRRRALGIRVGVQGNAY